MPKKIRHFKDLSDLDRATLRAILNDAKRMKETCKAGHRDDRYQGKTLAMIFEKPSTRTRISFDVGMRQLGGETIALTGSEMQLGHSETIADTARVLSRFVDIVTIRTSAHSRMSELADYSDIPVINALTDDTHPCQIMADIMTYEEHRGSIENKVFAWLGDGNNVTHSFLEAAALFGFRFKIATPEGSAPQKKYVRWALDNGADIDLTNDPHQAVEGADCVVTDTWVSMGQEFRARETSIFQPFQVNQVLMGLAKPDAVFMHCLPAHRGEEVTDEVIDGPQSIVFDEAENRLHAQKAIIAWCLGDSDDQR